MKPPLTMPFSELLGIRVTTSTPDLVEAEMEVRPDLCTIPAVLHGGALMALADSVGARGAHGEAIRRNGLRAEGVLGEFHLQPAKCVASAAEITGPVDVILFTVKLSDIETAAEQLRPIVGPETTLYTVQNGVEAAET